MKWIYHGNCYKGGQLYFFRNKKKIIFCYKNCISLIDFKFELIKNFIFHTRSRICAFDVNEMKKIIITIDSTKLLIVVNFSEYKIISKIILQNKIHNLKFSPMGNYFLTIGSNSLELWKFFYCKKNFNYVFQIFQVYRNHYNDILCIDWSEDGNYLITTSVEKVIRIFSFWKKSIFEMTVSVFLKKIFSIKFCLNSKKFIIFGENLLAEWFLYNNLHKKAEFFSFLNMKVTRVFFFSADKFQTVSSWIDLLSGTVFFILSTGKVHYLRISSQVYSYSNKNCQINGISKKTYHFKLFKVDPFGELRLFGCIGNDLLSICKIKKKEILIYNWFEKKFIFKYRNLTEKPTSIALSPNDKLVCTCNIKGDLVIWSVKSGLPFIEFHNHIDFINRIVFFKNITRMVFTSSTDGTIKSYDLKKCTLLKSVNTSSVKNLDALDIDSSGSFVVSACIKTFSIFVWSLKNGSVIEILQKHQGIICDVYFLRNKMKIISVSQDGFLILWHLSNNSNTTNGNLCDIFHVSHKILAVCYHPFKDEVGVLSNFGSISFFSMKKNLHIIGININVEKNKTHLESKKISIGYSFDGKKLFIKNLKLRIFYLYHFQLVFLYYYKITNDNFTKTKKKINTYQKNSLKVSNRKNFFVILCTRNFFSSKFDNNQINFLLNLYLYLKKNFSRKKQWENIFKWLLVFKKNKLYLLLSNLFSWKLIRKFFGFLLWLKNYRFGMASFFGKKIIREKITTDDVYSYIDLSLDYRCNFFEDKNSYELFFKFTQYLKSIKNNLNETICNINCYLIILIKFLQTPMLKIN